MSKNEAQTVMIIDDDNDLRTTIALLLDIHGLTSVQAVNGKEALEKIAVRRPAVILLDMKMPVMDGKEFANQFKNRFTTDIPIIVLTAAANARQHAEEIGAKFWLGKPFNMDELVSLVQGLL